MCLGVPMKITELRGDKAIAQLGGVSREVSLMLVENVRVGQYVLVHAGFGISVVDEETANETLELLEEKYSATDDADSSRGGPSASEQSR